jgi:acetyl-CoA carboxylase carboxyltransferase component
MRATIEHILSEKRQMREEERSRVVAKYGMAGKLSATQRLEALFDEGTFREIGAFVRDRGEKKTAISKDAVITGYGYVNGDPVYAYAQDYSLAGGSLGQMHAEKIAHVQDAALRAKAPIVALLESGGARIQEGVDALDGYGSVFRRNCAASGTIPQIAVIFGSCAGGAVYSPALMDFVFVIDQKSRMFLTGPEVVRTVTGENVTAEALGGAGVHGKTSGVAHFVCNSERDSIQQVRTLLPYLTQSQVGKPAAGRLQSRIGKQCLRLDELVSDNPKKSYDMKSLVSMVVDNGKFFEYQQQFARNCVTGFARIGGRAVGIVANQPLVLAGCIDIDASVKMARFIRTCDCFGLPIVTFVDTPGYLPGLKQEQGGVIRHGAKLLYAYSTAQVPLVTVVVRKAYGGAYIAMGSKSLGADAVFAWPFAEIAVLGADGASKIIYKKELAASQDPGKLLAQKAQEYRQNVMDPHFAAGRGYVDDIIRPAETRNAIMDTLGTLGRKTEGKGHGNIPL